MERLRLGLLNLKEDGNGISIGDKLLGMMNADLRILCSSSYFLSRQRKCLFLGRFCQILLLRTLSFQRHTLLDKQSSTSSKLGKNMHLGPLLILQGLIQSHSGNSQEQILFQTDFNKTDFF